MEPRERHAVPPRERPEREDRLEAKAPKAQELLRSYLDSIYTTIWHMGNDILSIFSAV